MLSQIRPCATAHAKAAAERQSKSSCNEYRHNDIERLCKRHLRMCETSIGVCTCNLAGRVAEEASWDNAILLPQHVGQSHLHVNDRACENQPVGYSQQASRPEPGTPWMLASRRAAGLTACHPSMSWFTWRAQRPTAPTWGDEKPSFMLKAARRSKPKGCRAFAHALMLLWNTAELDISSKPIFGHWLPLPGWAKLFALVEICLAYAATPTLDMVYKPLPS